MGRFVLGVMFVAGCGFHPSTSTNAPADATNGDAEADAPDGAVPLDAPTSCMQHWLAKTPRFTSPVPLSVNTGGYERDPFLSPDELSIYVSTDRGASGTTDTFVATRSSLTGAWGTATLVAQLSTTTANETKVSMTSNGLYAVLGSDKSGGSGGIDVWESSRPNTGAVWGALSRTHVMSLETNANEHDPEISADGLHLYFAPDGGGQHIAVASRTSPTANFGAPATITAIMDPGNSGDGDPTLSPDERVIVFSSNRVGTGKAGGNLWYAVRDSASATFGTPMPVPDVNTDDNDGDAHLSPDGCRLYLANDAGGDWNLYAATMM